MDFAIIDVGLDNMDKYPPVCFINPKNAGYRAKAEWLKQRFAEGMKIKLLRDNGDGKIHGFIEYVPGEYAWRAVEAKGYNFIHCLWTTPNSHKNSGIASKLIQACIKDAEGNSGTAVIASDDAFMADKRIFLKNGFEVVEESGNFTLLVKKSRNGNSLKFMDTQNRLAGFRGWNIVYSAQCPWGARFISELDKKMVEKLQIKITELKTASEAQNAPSIYSVFTLIHDGEILADHYISNTRFNNIIKKAESK